MDVLTDCAREINMNEWIPVKERLPETDKLVLVYRSDHGFNISYYDDNNSWFEPNHQNRRGLP